VPSDYIRGHYYFWVEDSRAPCAGHAPLFFRKKESACVRFKKHTTSLLNSIFADPGMHTLHKNGNSLEARQKNTPHYGGVKGGDEVG
jgi:hypothetical protein